MTSTELPAVDLPKLALAQPWPLRYPSPPQEPPVQKNDELAHGTANSIRQKILCWNQKLLTPTSYDCVGYPPPSAEKLDILIALATPSVPR